MSMKVLLAAFVAVSVVVAAPGEKPKDNYATLIVGKWEVSKADAGTVPEGSVIEFTKDGKMKIAHKKGGEEFNLDGTYKMEGDKFTFSIKIGDDEKSQTITITKLTETTLVTKDKDDKAVEFTKKK